MKSRNPFRFIWNHPEMWLLANKIGQALFSKASLHIAIFFYHKDYYLKTLKLQEMYPESSSSFCASYHSEIISETNCPFVTWSMSFISLSIHTTQLEINYVLLLNITPFWNGFAILSDCLLKGTIPLFAATGAEEDGKVRKYKWRTSFNTTS